MSSKRNRISRSSSQGEVVSFCSILRPITDSPVAIWGKKRSTASSASASASASGNPVMPVIKNYYSTENRGKIIWTLGSSSAAVEDNRGVQVDESFGAFWQACAFCKKPLTDQMNIFMYGYLQAFCSVECRHAQIAKDERSGRPFPQRPAASTPNKPGNSSASRSATYGYGSSSQGEKA